MGMQSHSIQNEADLYYILSMIRKALSQLSFTEMDHQKVLVSVSELTRNVLDHANQHGIFSFETFFSPSGIRIQVKDFGPGIENLSSILCGHGKESPSKGLGLGLTGVYRLMDEVSIETTQKGTSIIATKWSGSETRKTR